MKSLHPGPGNRLMGILLTGMGEDGANGIAYIKKMGGITIVQEPGTCAIRSMPLTAIATGSVDYILPRNDCHHDQPVRFRQAPFLSMVRRTSCQGKK